MEESATGGLAQAIGFLGVTLSLLFVGFEIKQSRDIAIAEIYQERSNMAIELIFSRYSPEQWEAAQTELRSESPQLSRFQVEVLEGQLEANFIYFENMHFQYEIGMVTEEEWLSTSELIRGFFRQTCVPEWWTHRVIKSAFRKSFSLTVDELLSNTETQSCRLSPPPASN